MRSTGMGSTLLGSALSPKSADKKNSFLDASIGDKRSPRSKAIREVGNILTDAVEKKAEEQEFDRQNETLLTNRDLPFDEATGL